LAGVNKLDLLNQLYGTITIPIAVHEEITVKGSGEAGSEEVQTLKWIEVKSVSNRKFVKALQVELDDGESEAIALATELKANLVLLDERRGRSVAKRFGLHYIGILGVLIEAKQKGLIQLIKPILDDLISKSGFWISPGLYDRMLEVSHEGP
jgi:hypothetical protein